MTPQQEVAQVQAQMREILKATGRTPADQQPREISYTPLEPIATGMKSKGAKANTASTTRKTKVKTGQTSVSYIPVWITRGKC